MLMLIGVLLYGYNVLHPGNVQTDAGADRVFPSFVLTALPHGFRGLFISAALAAGMASLASMVNAMGTASLLDVWKVHWDDGGTELKWIQRARWMTLVWGVISFAAAFMVLKFGTVITAGIKLGAVIIGAIFGMFLLGIFFRRANAIGVMVGALSGLGVLVAILLRTSISWTWYCLIGTVVTIVVGFLASLLVNRNNPHPRFTWWDLPPPRGET